MKATLKRLIHEDKQTLSSLEFYNNEIVVLSVKALELPDRDNQRNISRIPSGTYQCSLRWSEKYDWHYHINNVPNRSLILMHFGNYYTDTRGCILVGNAFKDINSDGYRDVTSSKKTMKRILGLAPNQFELTIVDD